jgi:hypothetical protein
MIELHATQTRQMHIGDQTTFQSRDSKQENLRLTHKSLPHNPTIERSVQSPSARIHRGRQWKSLLALTVPEGRVAALFTWQLGADCRAERPGSCSVMGEPPLYFFSVAQPCEPDLIARIIIRREWQGRNLITVNPRLAVPPAPCLWLNLR